jgi:hypothetical protein
MPKRPGPPSEPRELSEKKGFCRRVAQMNADQKFKTSPRINTDEHGLGKKPKTYRGSTRMNADRRRAKAYH